jgi:2-polyprenyl-3-methyl-5-hydroxy-6-metoxy-1,4-benzoquinol methylase
MRPTEVTVACPQCRQASPLAFRAKDFNRRLSSEVFDYYRCPACHLIFLSPIPANLGSYYPQDYYTLPQTTQRLDRIAEALRYQIELVRRFVPTGRLLEIGPAYGAFAHLAKKAGFDVEAIEMDQRCCAYLSEVVGVRAINSDDPAGVLPTLEQKDVIALWHVVEHLPDPWTVLERAAERLRPGGILLVAAPNPDASQFRLLRSHWPHLDAPRHVELIPARLLIRRLASAGLEAVLVTTNDQGGRGWNVFGWQKSLVNLSNNRRMQWLMWRVGWVFGKAVGVLESGEMKGSTYTMILRKMDRR